MGRALGLNVLALALATVLCQGCSVIVDGKLDELDESAAGGAGGQADGGVDGEGDGESADAAAGGDADGAAAAGTDGGAAAGTGGGAAAGTGGGAAAGSGGGADGGVDASTDAGSGGADAGGEAGADGGAETCEDLDCGSRQRCVEDADGARCECETGYGGDNCDECAVGYQDNDGNQECELDCDSAGLSCGDNAGCVDDSGTAQCECDPGHVGADCSSCDDGYQDNDGDGRCEPDCATAARDCSGHGSCDDSSGAALCVCDPTYAGDDCESCTTGFALQSGNCEWSGVVQNGGFTGDSGWTVDGSASIASNWAAFPSDASCYGGTVSQSVPMPELVDSGPLVLRFAVRLTGGVSSPSIGVGVDGVWHHVRVSSVDTWEDQTVCLNDGVHGDALDVVFGRYTRPSACTFDTIATFHVDNVDIAPAEADECPAQGSFVNGDFEAGDTGWTAVASGVAEVHAGTEVSGDYNGYLGTTERCQNASLEGLMFTPTTAGIANTAIEVTYQGTAGRALNIYVDDMAIGRLRGTGSTMTSQICLAEWARGRVFRLKFELPHTQWECGTPDVRDFYIDDLSFVSEVLCPDGELLLDGSFEYDAVDIASGWRFDKQTNNNNDNLEIDVQTLLNPPLARSGSCVLSVQAAQLCTHAAANTTLQVPYSESDAGPALHYYYRLPTLVNGVFAVCLYDLASYDTLIECQTLSEAADYTAMTLCIDPTFSGRTVNVQVMADGGSGGCATTYATEAAYLDDISVTTDSSCPF